MPYLGFMRNGRLSCLQIGSVEAARNHVSAGRDSQDYVRQVRILDERSKSYWRIVRGQWQEFDLDEDLTVQEMIASLGIDIDERHYEPRRVVMQEPVATSVAVAEPVVKTEARETVIDLRTHTRGRARREGRRKR